MSEKADTCLDCGQPFVPGQRKHCHYPRWSVYNPPKPAYCWHGNCPVESELARAGLSKRVRLRLHRAGVRTVEELTRITLADLKNLRHFGKKAIAEVQMMKARNGSSGQG